MPKLHNLQFFKVRNSGIHGKGAFATCRIRKGSRIAEYVGERISHEEGDTRYPDIGQPHYHTFLFAIDDEVCIDAARMGNDARFINHSCAPNCEAVSEDGRIFIETIAMIEPGEELTYDYALIGPRPRTKAERARFACFCGESECRGTMLGAPKPRRQRVKA